MIEQVKSVREVDLNLNQMKKEFEGFFFDEQGNAYNKRGRKLKYTFINNKETMMIGNKRYRVNEIIAKLFVPNPYDYNKVDHINGDPHDLHKDNLEWVLKPRRKSLKGVDHFNSRMSKNQVHLVRKLLAEGKLKQWEIALEVGCTQSRVTEIKQGKAYSDVE